MLVAWDMKVPRVEVFFQKLFLYVYASFAKSVDIQFVLITIVFRPQPGRKVIRVKFVRNHFSGTSKPCLIVRVWVKDSIIVERELDIN